MHVDSPGITYPQKDLKIYQEWIKSFEKFRSNELFDVKKRLFIIHENIPAQ